MRIKKQQSIIALLCFLSLFITFFHKSLQKDYDLAPYDLMNKFAPWSYSGENFQNPLLDDVITQFIPWDHLINQNINHHELPFWNPYSGCGEPLLANYQSAFFYPLTLISRFFPKPYLTKAFLKLLVCFIGMYCFLSLFLSDIISILFGSLSFTFCGFNMLWLNHPHSNISVLLPFLMFFWILFLKTTNYRYISGYIITASMQLLGGHPETAMTCSLIVFLFSIFFQVLDKEPLKKIIFNHLLIFPGTYLFSLLICAIQIIPFLEYLFSSTTFFLRPFIHEVNSLHFNIQIKDLSAVISILLPKIFGCPTLFKWNGPININEISTAFTGTVCVLLTFFSFSKKNQKHFIPFLLLALCSLFIIYANPLSVKLTKVYPLNIIDYKRFLLALAFTFSSLGAFGLEKIFQYKKKELFIRIFSFIFILLITYLSVIYFNSKVLKNDLFYHLILKENITPLFLVIFLIIIRKIFHPRTFKSLLIIIALYELFSFSYNFTPACSAKKLQQKDSFIELIDNDPSLFRVASNADIGIFPNLNIFNNIYTLKSYDAMGIRQYFKFLRQISPFPIHPLLPVKNFNITPDNPYFNFLNIKYFLSKKELNYSQLEEISLDPPPGYKVYINKKFKPRVFMCSNVIGGLTSSETLNTLLALNLNPDETVILDVEKSYKFPALNPLNESCIINDYSTNKIQFTVNNSYPRAIVISDTYDKNWQCLVNGKKTKLYRANYNFRAILLDKPGKYSVSLEYKPRYFFPALFTSILSLILLLLLHYKVLKKSSD